MSHSLKTGSLVANVNGMNTGFRLISDANLMTGMNLMNHGFQPQRHTHQPGIHMSNIHALVQLQHQHQQQQQQQQQGHAILGSGVNSSVAGRVTNNGTNNNQAGSQEGRQEEDYEYAVRLAAEANGKATMEQDFYKAILLYGQAISLHDADSRFFLNRSFCYAQLELFQLALDDAEQAIRLEPKSGKCFYRKGQALIGLKKFMDAEKAFQEVLRLEPDCTETTKQLADVRLMSLLSLGFDGEQSKVAALKYPSIEDAISALLALRMDDSLSDEAMPSPPSTNWHSFLWQHQPETREPHKTLEWTSIPAAHQHQERAGGGHQCNPSDGNPIASGIRSLNAVPAVPAGVIGHQTPVNQFASDLSTKGLDVSPGASPVNGFSSVVGSNGFAQRPDSSSPLDHHMPDSLLVNRQQDVIGGISGGHSPLFRTMAEQMGSVFDGASISRSCSGSGHGSAVNMTGNQVVASPHADYHPKNNNNKQHNNYANNNFNGITAYRSSSSSLLPVSGIQLQKQESSAVIGSGRQRWGSGEEAGGHVPHHAEPVIKIIASATDAASSAAALTGPASGVSILRVGASGDSESSVSPIASHDSDSSESSVTTGGERSAAGSTSPPAQHFTHHQVMVGAVAYKHHHGNQTTRSLASGGAPPAPHHPHHHPALLPVPRHAGHNNNNKGTTAFVWGSATRTDAAASSSGGGTFADIVKKKTTSGCAAAPASATGSRNYINHRNQSEHQPVINGRNHHHHQQQYLQPKDQMMACMDTSSDMDGNQHPRSNNQQIKDHSISRQQQAANNNPTYPHLLTLVKQRPTNIWGYNGLRVANVAPSCSRTTLSSLFSKFGKLKLVERITNKNVENQVWVFFDNPVSPVDVMAKYQGVVVTGVSLNNNTPLRLYFAATDDQKDLKFSRPKQPQDSRGECYYWRTTNCFSRDSCSLLHLPSCKNIGKSLSPNRLLPPDIRQSLTS